MNNHFDTIVIGGGAAGMIAAGRSAELGNRVLLLEKNPSLGAKLLISGGGRCNVTNISTDLRKNYKESGKYLGATFAQFSTEDTLEFFHSRGLQTKVENEGRVFPSTNSSQSVIDVLVEYMRAGNVDIRTGASVAKIEIPENDGDKDHERSLPVVIIPNAQQKSIVEEVGDDDKIIKISLHSGEKFTTKKCIIATGGTSHPETGSTGDGFRWLREMGHAILDNKSALVPLAIKEDWVKKLSGVTLQDIKLTVHCDDKKQFFKLGKILFTHFGVSGPTILNMSKKIGDLLHTGTVTVAIDLFPGTDHQALRLRLNELLMGEANRQIKNTLGQLVPNALIDVVLRNSATLPDTYGHSVTRDNRVKIVDQIKALKITVESLMGNDKAIVSSGGVDINEVDFKTMQSKIVPGLYLVGDMLNIDRPSGGYSLQLCWTTGYVAGNN